MSDIIVRGAREHNLDDVYLRLPRNRFVCFTGVSGSGKSSFAFDTLYAEGQRRYVESLSSYARQFLGQLPRPDVDQVLGLSPAISISQKTAGQNVRSTVGTITEISDYLRVLYARVATGYCPKCGRKIFAQTRSQILERLRIIPSGVSFQILAPLIRNQKGRCVELLNRLRRRGFRKVRIDGIFLSVDDEINLDRQARHSVDVVIDHLKQSDSTYRRLTEAVDLALQLGKGQLIVLLDRNPLNDRLRFPVEGQSGEGSLDSDSSLTDARFDEGTEQQTFNFSNVAVEADEEADAGQLEVVNVGKKATPNGSNNALESETDGFVDSKPSSKQGDVLKGKSSKSKNGQKRGVTNSLEQEDSPESNLDDGSTIQNSASVGEQSAQEANFETAISDELYFSADYACSHCNLSFERPTPQMFSFNNMQGMCPHCQGLGFVHTFDPALLIPDGKKSFQQGCVGVRPAPRPHRGVLRLRRPGLPAPARHQPRKKCSLHLFLQRGG